MTSRRILLCATGLSPQIVTETLYALAVQGGWLPDEIHLITTREGAERARLTLLTDDPGWFHRLRRDYALPPIRFNTDSIHVLQDGAGHPLEDIRTPVDNERAADTITQTVRRMTADPAGMVHASIAGGRKTMGFYLGYAMSLFGRPQDRLSHVLVSSPFESNQGFYYPTRYSRVIYGPPPDSRPLDTQDAVLTLADIPFVRLRDHLNSSLLAAGAGYSETVRRAQRSVGPAELVLDPNTRRVRCGDGVLRLSPINFAFYAWFAERTRAQAEPLTRADWSPSQARDILDHYLALTHKDPDSTEDATVRKLRNLAAGPDATAEALQNRLDYLDQRLSKLDRALVDAIGAGPARAYCVRNGSHRNAYYGLALQPEQVWFGEVM